VENRPSISTSYGTTSPRNDRLLLVAIVKDEVVGWGQVMHFQPPPEAPANHAPESWYLSSLLVAQNRRRLGIGAALIQERLAWVSTRVSEAYYFANSRNWASIALHKRFAFKELSRDIWFPDSLLQGAVMAFCFRFRTALPSYLRR
jgi:GNAT superfamily N-acetyltransferase